VSCRHTIVGQRQPTTNNTTTSIGGFLAAFLGTDAFTDTDLYAGSFCHRISQVIAHAMDVDGSFFCQLDDMAPSSVGSMTKFSSGEEGTAVVRKQSRRISTTGIIPNDTYASGAKNLTVISGINGSGKSTYLKQIAIIASYVPTEEAPIPVSLLFVSLFMLEPGYPLTVVAAPPQGFAPEWARPLE
jgi:hypothetical protein